MLNTQYLLLRVRVEIKSKTLSLFNTMQINNQFGIQITTLSLLLKVQAQPLLTLHFSVI